MKCTHGCNILNDITLYLGSHKDVEIENVIIQRGSKFRVITNNDKPEIFADCDIDCGDVEMTVLAPTAVMSVLTNNI